MRKSLKLSDVKAKAYKKYESKEIFRSFLEDRQLFPLVLSLPKLRSGELSQNFSMYREQIEKLSGECGDWGIELKFKTVHHRSLGMQTIPHEVAFATREVFLKFIAKQKEFEVFARVVAILLKEYPELKEFAIQYPEKLLEYKSVWPKLLSVCRFLIENPQLNLYIRQLEIPDIDTKFIENHRRILSELLNILTFRDASQSQLSEFAIHFFEERYGLKKEEPRLRFRLLDSTLRAHFFGLEDIETSAADLARHEIQCDQVFIVENKITGLCLPDCAGAMVFFELGYKAGLLKKISWLENKKLIYWGDIDTHGFAILSQLRLHFPKIESRLMNRETLLKYKHLWSVEAAAFTGDCPQLTVEEQALFQDLKWQRLGQGVRLEQERIALSEFKI